MTRHPDFIFLSEPQLYTNDLDMAMKALQGEYCASLNSADVYDPEIPLLKSKAHGGTMTLWKIEHDPFVSVCPVSSTSFLPIVFHPPSSPPSIHIGIYLPTLGQESQFIDEMSKPTICIEELLETLPEAPIYLRGDFNVSSKNKVRSNLLEHFCGQLDLLQVPIHHNTYHHFTGNGLSDSNLDRIMFSRALAYTETLSNILCKLSNPLVDSHHDLIISSWTLPDETSHHTSNHNVVAPKAENTRHRIVWSDSEIAKYQEMVLPHLSRLQELWLSSPSKTSLSLLLESTTNILTTSASASNKSISLDKKHLPSSSASPFAIRRSKNELLRKHKKLKQASSLSSTDEMSALKTDYSRSRTLHRKLQRWFKAKESVQRDEKLHEILSTNPSSVFRSIKSVKRGKNRKIQKLTVGTKTYIGSTVQDGFYDSISQLKSRDSEFLDNSQTFREFSSDYQNILKVCESGATIPPISEQKSLELLQKMKPSVNDFFGVTPNHYIYAGPSGWKHFYLLLSAFLQDVSNTTIFEINTVYACILFKGHRKERTSDRSYRTISSCPVVAKALDLYIRDLHIDDWNQSQAETQFQGEGSSHELAAVLLTETIQHSLHTLKKPIFILYLDARSAFDVVLKELLIKNLFSSNTVGHSLLYLNNRLENRQTFIDWEGQLMGPINDEQGLEQGGVNSSDFYKIFGKEQLETAQASKLGIPLGPLTISGIGQADDTALVSNRIQALFYLLHLTLIFCSKYNVQLSSEKTKLQVIYNKDMSQEIDYIKSTNPILINGEVIKFVDTTEHVGMTRSTTGNLPTILDRVISHRKALGGVLHAGMARGHRGNPAAGLRVHQLYGNPVLFSGLAPLVMNKKEMEIVEQHHKDSIRNIQRLLAFTPRTVICFLAGSLPGTAILHLRQLSIFGMICRLNENILHKHATNIFNYSTMASKSWFSQIRDLCLLYNLPHPSILLSLPPTKTIFKNLAKKHVIDYWEKILRLEAEPLTSLEFFKPAFMSLSTPHPLWKTAGQSPAKVSMATIQAQMLSGRYRTEMLCSHWSNRDGTCLLSPLCNQEKEDLRHILISCTALTATREKLTRYTLSFSQQYPLTAPLLLKFCAPSSPQFCQFLLDCSVIPSVILETQQHGMEVLHDLFNVTRTWCYTLHKERMKLLGRRNPF